MVFWMVAMIVTIVGAGGKTTICNSLGAVLAQRGHRVLMTTSTQIYRPDNCPVFIGNPEALSPQGNLTVAGMQEIENGKIKGFSGPEIDTIEQKGLFDYIIVEGDGAKSRSVKAPAEWEPVYPSFTRLALGVIGLDCIGKPIFEDNVHRSTLFMQLTGSRTGDRITIEHLYKLIHHPEGLFRHAPQNCKKVVLFNKSDLVGNNTQEIEDFQRKADFPVFSVSRNTDWTAFIQRLITLAKGFIIQ